LIEERLIRAVGVRGLTAAIVNYTVGAGIFVLPALVAAKVGAAAPMVYVLCAFAMGLVVLCFASAGSRVSLSGGAYAYAEVAFGQYVGFMIAVCLWLSTILASASVANVLLDALSQISPILGTSAVRTGILLALYGVLALINIRGVRIGSNVVQTVTAAKLIPVLILVMVGVFAINGANLSWPGMPSAADTTRTVVVLIFAFTGIESALIPSGEVHNPARTVPRSILAALVLVTVLYIAIQLVTQGILGAELATNTKAPLAEAARRVLGRGGEVLVVVGTAISTLGYIAGDMLAAPRVIYALGRDSLLPNFFGAVHDGYRTPHVAIVTHAILSATLAITGSFAALAVLAVLLTLIVYLSCCLATIQLQRKDVRADGAVPFTIPGGPVIPVVAAAIIVWLMASSTLKEFVALAIMLTIASPLYLLGQSRRKAMAVNSDPH
jgi:basic amino acid/polyamine antiporter, APA family